MTDNPLTAVDPAIAARRQSLPAVTDTRIWRDLYDSYDVLEAPTPLAARPRRKL